jgi:DNA-binding MarR family transcriptional regulator
MADKIMAGPAFNNIRTLIHFLGEKIDANLAQRRSGTAYAGVRPSDVRTFVMAARATKSISEIARQLGISRQSAQASVHRLIKLGVLNLASEPENRRQKQVVLTARGQMANKTAAEQILAEEEAMAADIGRENLEQLRTWLEKLLGL